jgi:hypothetical protein
VGADFLYIFQRTWFLKKSDEFVGFNGSDLVVRRVFFRYVSLNFAFVSIHSLSVGCSRILEYNFVCVLVSHVL